MHMVGPHIHGPQNPTSHLTSFTDSRLDRLALVLTKRHGLLLEHPRIVAQPFLVRRDVRCSVLIVNTIGRASLVSV
jgi:hypothetical protein